jgi:hypothetical protein
MAAIRPPAPPSDQARFEANIAAFAAAFEIGEVLATRTRTPKRWQDVLNSFDINSESPEDSIRAGFQKRAHRLGRFLRTQDRAWDKAVPELSGEIKQVIALEALQGTFSTEVSADDIVKLVKVYIRRNLLQRLVDLNEPGEIPSNPSAAMEMLDEHFADERHTVETEGLEFLGEAVHAYMSIPRSVQQFPDIDALMEAITSQLSNHGEANLKQNGHSENIDFRVRAQESTPIPVLTIKRARADALLRFNVGGIDF